MADDYPEAPKVARAPKAGSAGAGGGAGGAAAGSGGYVVVVLEQAALETVKTKKGFELLNCDDHQGMHKKHGRDPADSRPDVCHQALMALLDSPLNKAGKLRVYIRTAKNVLIEVSPSIRIPRTFKRFAGLMVQLLHKMRIRSSTSTETLLKVVKNPVTAHLPVGARIIGTSRLAKLIDPFELVASLPADKPIVFVFGAMARGFVTADYVEEQYSFSQFPLSAATAINRLMAAFESAWDIL